jgi:hypothetical protein
VERLWLSVYEILSFEKQQFDFFSNLDALYVFFLLIILEARASRTMFNKSDERRYPCLVPDLRERFHLPPLTIMLAVGLLYMAFI